MKQVVMVMVALLFASCGKKEELAKYDLVGTWKGIHQSPSGPMVKFYHFNGNGTVTFSETPFDTAAMEHVITWKQENDSLYFTADKEGVPTLRHEIIPFGKGNGNYALSSGVGKILLSKVILPGQ